MQQLLSGVIGAEFGLNVEVVNGATRRGGDTHSMKRSRKGIIDRFRQTEGFNVIILSPDVAGIGLTITEANHVIHYGRWWNPARESQATDRGLPDRTAARGVRLLSDRPRSSGGVRDF